MFWTYGNVGSSQIDSLLDKPEGEVSLTEILEQEDVIQEVKSQNMKLIDYLSTPDVLSDLIRLIITEPAVDDVSEASRFRLPHFAAEILTCEVQKINEKISSDENLLGLLYSFLENGSVPLNPLLSSFFSKAFGVLITRKSEQNWFNYQCSCLQVLDFLKKKDLVSDLIRHIGTSAISDLILSLITCIDVPEMKQGLLDWLNEKKLIESILGLLDPSHDRDTHDNASRLLVEILRVSRDAQYAPPAERCNDPLLKTLEDPATTELVLEIMFRKDANGELKESTLVNSILILQTLVETRSQPLIQHAKQQNSPSVPMDLHVGSSSAMLHINSLMMQDPDPIPPEELLKSKTLLDATVGSLLPRMEDLTRLLVEPPKKEVVRTTAGVLDPPLGITRIGVAKLMSALLATNHPDVNQKMMECKTIDILLDLFFKYSLNNFLHREVEHCLEHIFAWNPNVKLPEVEKKTEQQEKMDTEEETESKKEGGQEEEEKKGENEETPPYQNPLLMHLFTSCRLVERVLDAWEENDSEEKRQHDPEKHQPGAGKNRKGYMGHLTKIANIMVKNGGGEGGSTSDNSPQSVKTSSSESTTTSSEALAVITSEMSKLPPSTSENWASFVSGSLAATNARNVVTPAQPYSGHNASSSEDDDLEGSFNNDSSLQQMFADYQMQQMSEHFVDSFGLAEEAGDDGASKPASLPRLTNVSFDDDEEASDDDNEGSGGDGKKKSSQQLFEEACNAKLNLACGGEDDDDDLWADRTKEISFSDTAGAASSKTESAADEKSSSEDEEVAEASSKKMEIDVSAAEEERKRAEKEKEEQEQGKKEESWPLPTAASEAETPPIAMDTGNPWEEEGTTAAAAATTPAAAVEEKETKEDEAPVQRCSTPPAGGWAASFLDDSTSSSGSEAAPTAPKEAWAADFNQAEEEKKKKDEEEEEKENKGTEEEKKKSEEMTS